MNSIPAQTLSPEFGNFYDYRQNFGLTFLKTFIKKFLKNVFSLKNSQRLNARIKFLIHMHLFLKLLIHLRDI